VISNLVKYLGIHSKELKINNTTSIPCKFNSSHSSATSSSQSAIKSNLNQLLFRISAIISGYNQSAFQNSFAIKHSFKSLTKRTQIRTRQGSKSLSNIVHMPLFQVTIGNILSQVNIVMAIVNVIYKMLYLVRIVLFFSFIFYVSRPFFNSSSFLKLSSHIPWNRFMFISHGLKTPSIAL
jgi:hypothetical protein